MDRNLNQRILNRVLDAGCTTEKDIENLTMAEVLRIPGITKGDMILITKLQAAVKEKRLILFLAGMEQEE